MEGKMSEQEKFAAKHVVSENGSMFTVKEADLDKEKIAKFNDEVERYQEMLEENNRKTEEVQKDTGFDFTKLDIRPLYTRLLIKPYDQNPFQKLEMKNGIITDTGGYTPHYEINPQTGKYEIQQAFILTGCVVEVGPKTKYVKPGDVVFYRRDTAVPVPYFKLGMVSIDENQVISVVATDLEERFKGLNND